MRSVSSTKRHGFSKKRKKKKRLELLQHFLGTCENTYEPAHTSGSEKLGHLFLRVGRVVN